MSTKHQEDTHALKQAGEKNNAPATAGAMTAAWTAHADTHTIPIGPVRARVQRDPPDTYYIAIALEAGAADSGVLGG